MNKDFLFIKGAREKNLQDISVKIPKNKLVVITGVSGSGKTSLAFSTIYNEGKRRYVESLSSYARQFLGNSEKPDVDQIINLSPAIAIDQKTTSHNPRSIVGTMTEIYDYLRLLYARAGTSYCINCHEEITTTTVQQMVDQLKLKIKPHTSITIYSPTSSQKKGTFKTLFQKLKKEGFWTVLVNNQIYNLDQEIELDKNKKHTIWILVDQIRYHSDQNTQSRIYSSLETAIKYSNGIVIIKYQVDGNPKEILFSERFNCHKCGFGLKELEPRLFSFNTVSGACYDCKGLGTVLDLDFERLTPDLNLSINQGGINYFKKLIDTNHRDWLVFKALCKRFKINMDKAVKKITKREWNFILNGSGDIKLKYTFSSKTGSNKWNFNHPFQGLKNIIQKRFLETSTKSIHNIMARKFLSNRRCPSCLGRRLNNDALSVKINGLNISEFTELTIDRALNFIFNLKLDSTKMQIVKLVINEIKNRLSFLEAVGLNYLTLNRYAQTLSGGEAQRIRLATQIGSKLTGILYVLDEPSIGLHQYDNQKLINTLKQMRDLGNSILVVEHDEETMLNADWIVDIGLYGGIYGGNLIHSGDLESLLKNKNSITGKFLRKELSIPVPKVRRKGNKKVLKIYKASENNLQNLTFDLPLNKLVVITGISGSGKSTLVKEIIYKGVKKKIDPHFLEKPGKFKDIKNTENLERLIFISQEPIGKTPRSNPATYTKVFTDIREVFANTFEARKRGYKIGRFSFNVWGGRCEKCQGDGLIYHSMLFLPDVYVKCETCNGSRYNQETLQIVFKNKNISDVLNMEVDKAYLFFQNQPKIQKKLKVLIDVGLGYLKLGQPSTQLSGGEAQRIKLATYLQKKLTGKTMYILDEPTTGLHAYDVAKLLKLLNTLVDQKETVLLIEHNLDVIKSADYIIDLGPKGGEFGGQIIASGTPEEVAKNPNSFTGKYLKDILAKEKQK